MAAKFTDQSFASSNSLFFSDKETLISQPNQKKPRYASWWWSIDESFNALGVIFNKPSAICLYSTAGVLKPPPEVIVIDDEIDEETPESSDIFNNTPPISSPSSSAVSKSPPDVIVIDDDEEEETVAISNDNNPKLDSNDKKSAIIVDNEEDWGSVVIDSEKSSNNGGDGGFGHVTFDELGVTIEDLKNIPWEAFDPNWEIKSVIMDPWLGGYIQQLSNN